MEDHRFFDMVRWEGYDFNIVTWINGYMARDGVRYLNTNNNYMKGAKFVKNKHEYLPIPLTQIDLSYKDGEPVLVQNPGY